MKTLISWNAWLAVYLRSWFHLDWDDEFDTARDVLQARLNKLDPELGGSLLGELRRFVAAANKAGEAEAARNLRELTIFTRTPREDWETLPFLELVLEEFERHFTAREDE
jgi:hypothetical protein